MLGFGKKKKKESEEESGKDLTKKKDQKDSDQPDDTSADSKKSSKAKKKKKKKKPFNKKLIFIVFLLLVATGTSGYIVYNLYFTTKDPLEQNTKYQKINLEHINLPDEIIIFTFTHFRKLYLSMVDFNKEINLLDQEILRIETVAKNYPDQKKIADKQKKIWEKIKGTLEKTFIKIEKPIKNIYVLFSVNREQGLLLMENKKSELTQLAQDALTTTNEKTLMLKQKEIIPAGFIQGNIYKLKKKFL